MKKSILLTVVLALAFLVGYGATMNTLSHSPVFSEKVQKAFAKLNSLPELIAYTTGGDSSNNNSSGGSSHRSSSGGSSTRVTATPSATPSAPNFTLPDTTGMTRDQVVAVIRAKIEELKQELIKSILAQIAELQVELDKVKAEEAAQ